ncbi:hypothetical protein BD324DRAFT_626853 [Kockovaella imperatae]|uniref:DUF1748-domain-containing protein n=1 Tax=Kockovaella imperatae TaxID=4999 RepID=A0A1Y1UGP6_9TREE|nr:hypothetical protein BD324DRAFT_626853 [Kockovaella imperatae]ORX36697.1 hypothetical protein BD324DRAFT_626853 [Kockovaella imperatae]
MFGRLTRLTVDLVAISVLIAGVKKSTGYAPRTERIKDTALRRFFDSYFALGDTVFGMVCGFVVNSRYFKRTIEP